MKRIVDLVCVVTIEIGYCIMCARQRVKGMDQFRRAYRFTITRDLSWSRFGFDFNVR